MTWTWTRADQKFWAELAAIADQALGEIEARSVPYRTTARTLAKLCKRALRVPYPSNDPATVERFRALLKSASMIATPPDHAHRSGFPRARRQGVNPGNAAADVAAVRQLRLPYRDD